MLDGTLHATLRARRGVSVQQSTIARRVACSGIGLHGGEEVELALCPAAADTGIVFVSLATAEADCDVEFSASAAAVVSTSRSTTLGSIDSSGVLGAKISTVEHLLATLHAFAIDNVRVEVRGAEIPAMDGSAARFAECIRGAGRSEQELARREMVVVEPFEIRDGDRWIRVEPANGLRISYAIDFPHPSIGRQFLEIADLDESTFVSELAAARTFVFANEVATLHEAGLAHGGSLDNTLVLDDSGILNRGGLHWPDEFVRHKIVDLVGDLALLGAPLRAHVRVEKGGHRLHLQMVQALLDRPDLFEIRVQEGAAASNPPSLSGQMTAPT